MPTMFPLAFDAYVDPARARSEWWRTLIGFVLILAIGLVFAASILLVFWYIRERQMMGAGYAFIIQLTQGRTFFASALSIGLLWCLIPAAWIVTRYLHKRSFLTIISSNGRIDWRIWQIGAIVMSLYLIVSVVINFLTTEPPQQYSVVDWIPLALSMLVLTFFQTAAEEIVFRGYLLQQLAARFQSRWVWMVAPSLVFGALHYNTTVFGNNVWLVVANASVLGILLADLTSRVGTLSAAMGIHFANNVFALIIIALPGQASGGALFLSTANPKSPEAALGIMFSLVITVALYGVFLAISKRRRL